VQRAIFNVLTRRAWYSLECENHFHILALRKGKAFMNKTTGKAQWQRPDFEHVPLGAEVTAYISSPYPRPF